MGRYDNREYEPDNEPESEWEDDPEDPQEADQTDDDAETDTVPCSHCGREIAEFADRCPHCGAWVVPGAADQPKPRSGWIVIVILLMVIVVLLWAVR